MKTLLQVSVPDYATELLPINLDASSLHMEFLREAVQYNEPRFFARAMQFGVQHATYPLLYSWAGLSSNLRKYAIYCFLHHSFERPSLPLLPCSRVRLIDFLEWLPHNGVTAGWTSIRHFYASVRTWSIVCGHGDIVGIDKPGFDVWQKNFEANTVITTAPRGGDFPLRPYMLRGLANVYTESSPWHKLTLTVASLMWFSALRPGHFSPQSNAEGDCKHLLQWANVITYDELGGELPLPAAHFSIPSGKTRQKQRNADWSTATCCICEGASGSKAERLVLHRLCPICSLERWRKVAPPSSKFVICKPNGSLWLRDAFNKELRRGLRQALFHDGMPPDFIEQVIAKLASKSWRSGAATVIVTAGTAPMIAADFLGHGDPKITQTYYNKAGDTQRLALARPLAAALDARPKPDSLPPLSE